MASSPSLTTLKRQVDFRKVRQQGRRSRACRWLTIYSYQNDVAKARFGFVLSRHVGIAVVRNRLKRWTKEHIRQSQRLFEHNCDFVFVFSGQPAEAFRDITYEELVQQLTRFENTLFRK